MDSSERIVNHYLRSKGYSDIVYEPDGNVPPDFLVNGRIAIEVRRLNQNVISVDGSVEGIEESFVPIWQALKRYLPTLGPAVCGESWFVSIDMRRPIESWRELKPMVRLALLQFMHSSVREPTTIKITRNLKLNLMPTETEFSSFFLLGAAIDFDAGGFVVAEVLRNLALCISQKEQKVALYRHKYPEWWLILPDYIGGSLDSEDQRQFRSVPRPAHSWDKVILLNPSNPTDEFEI